MVPNVGLNPVAPHLAEGETIGLPAYVHAGANSKYKGYVGSKNRSVLYFSIKGQRSANFL